MRAEIIATGTELLTGGLLDTNSLYLSEELLLLGIETAFKTAVADNERDMEEAVQRAMGRTDLVIVTGGIGPTEDDITRKVVSKITKKRLILNEDALKDIHTRLLGRPREIVAANDRQALIPAGARLLRNPAGIAPGFTIDEERLFIAVLPGVPVEMRAMFSEGLRPLLEQRFRGTGAVRRKILHTSSLSESAVNGALQELLRLGRPVVGLTAGETGVDIRIIAHATTVEQAQGLVEEAEKTVREKLGDAVYGADGATLAEVVGALLKQRRLSLAVAESCTGGMIGARITAIPGSSEYFIGGVTAYSNRLKQSLLEVPADLLERQGAVSSETAAAMAQGIRHRADTALGLAVTGIAGPDGGSDEKPVGLVYTGLADREGVRTTEHRFLGNREQVRMRAAQAALDMVRRYLIS